MKPKTYCEKWPVGCQFCDLLMCDGKKETAEKRCNPCKPTQPECGECEFAKPTTNADRIRSMTDEELANFLFENVDCYSCQMHGIGCSVDCEKWMLSWLKSPEVDNGT